MAETVTYLQWQALLVDASERRGHMPPGVGVGATYLRWALDLSESEQRERDRLLSRLPEVVVDAHIHSTDADSVGAISEYGWAQARSSFPEWPVPGSDQIRSFLYGNRRVRRLFMAHPFCGIDHRRANRYLLSAIGPDDRVLLCGLPDDSTYTTVELASGRYSGLKMYPHYREPPYGQLDEYFPDWAMTAAADAGVPAVVHLPLPLAECVDDLLVLADRHPRTRIVLAHLGRQSRVNDAAVTAFARAAERPHVAMDTSMATDAGVHELAYATFGPRRVLYGSDEPFNLLRYSTYQHPTLGLRLIGPRRYHWLAEKDFAAYRHLGVDAHLVHLQVLRAIVDTTDRIFGAAEAPGVLRQVFHHNAADWFSLTG
jgi:hypothetical protein